MYKSKTFYAKGLAQVFADIEDAAKDCPEAHRVFLADGDALMLDVDHLLALLEKLHEAFPRLARVSCYATPINVNKKSLHDLERLKAAGLTLIYFGLESGSDNLLKRVRKGSARAMEDALKRADDAGLKVSATVILGLGGQTLWRDHIEQTAELINRQPPRFLSTLQLGLDADVKANFLAAFAKEAYAKGSEPFVEQDDAGILDELELLLLSLDPPSPVIFRSNHASNCLALAGTLPKDGHRLVSQVRQAQVRIADFGSLALRPRHLRGL
jgi:hypothetical protein